MSAAFTSWLAPAFDRFCAAGRDPDQLDYTALEVATVRGFLDWLHRERRCGPRTRNQRLAALKSFARYVALVAPEHLERCRGFARCRQRDSSRPR